MVVKRPTFDEGLEIGRNGFHLKAGHISQLHQGMCPDVTAATGKACTLRVDAPVRLLTCSSVLHFLGEPALQVVRVHPADIADETSLYDVSAEAVRPMSEVGVRYAEWDFELARCPNKSVGLSHVQTKWLLAKHRDTRLHGFHYGIVMYVVGSDDDHVVEPVRFWQTRVRFDHFIVGTVTPDRVGPPLGLLRSGLLSDVG